MAIKTYDADPYFDDYSTSNLDNKNYLRILFKPGVSVQVRELNQLQSMLQSQIDKLGRSVYKEGPVLDATTYFETTVPYIDVTINSGSSSTNAQLNTNISRFLGKKISEVGSGVRVEAEIYAYESVSTEGNQTWRFYLRYTSSGVDSTSASVQTNTSEFEANSPSAVALTTTLQDSTGAIVLSSGLQLGEITSVGYAAEVITDSGVLFSKGSFIYNDSTQRLFIQKPSKDYNITGVAAFRINDVVKTSSQDSSLFDNAAGTPNDRAPGADRYAVEFSTVFLVDPNDGSILSDLTSSITMNTGKVLSTATATSSVNYLSLLNVGAGEYIAPAKPKYSQLDDKLATRTLEESGDYTVKPFVMTTREYRNDLAGNGGLFTDTQIIAQEATVADAAGAQTFGEARYAASLEPGVSYVKGYRIPLETTQNFTALKARTTSTDQSVFTQATLGNYIELSAITQLPKIKDASSTGVFTFGTLDSPAGDNVTCKVRGIEYISATNYRLYIYHLSGEIPRNVTHIFGPAEDNGSDFVGVLTESNTSEPTPIFDTAFKKGIINLPYSTIESISDAGSASNVIVRAAASGLSANSSGQVTITVANIMSASGAANGTSCTNGVFFSDALTQYMLVDDSGNIYTPTSVDFSAASGTSLTLTNTNLTASDTNVQLIAPVRVRLNQANGLKAKSKTITPITDEVVTSGLVATNQIFNLDERDVISITSVKDGSDNALSLDDFELVDNGQRDAVYKVGKIKYTGVDSPEITGLKVTYKYFLHGAGDYFSVNSYITGGVSYSEIPQYKGVYLTDVLDFRPDDNDTAAIHFDPNSAVSTKVDYYLARYDRLIVNSVGDYKLIQGEPGVDPDIPDLPDLSMALYDLYIPAYTRAATDIQTKIVDNRRYTMRDIGRMEKRIKNLEYYTSLSLLEREATGKQILDSGGTTERFKNGILVDSFLTQGIADVLDPGYQASIDMKNGILRPLYSLNQKRLKYAEKAQASPANTIDSTTVTHANRGDGKGNLLTLPFTDSVLIDQPSASIDISVNPFDLASWNGSIELSPASDEWVEVQRRPKSVINIEGNIDAIANILNENQALLTEYDSVENHIIGKPLSSKSKTIYGSGTSQAKIDAGFVGYRPVRETTQTFQTLEVKSGIGQEAVINSVETDMGDRVIDVSIIPSIRSRRVFFKASMLKPNTRMYLFFDNQDITAYAHKTTFENYYNQNTDDYVGTSTFGKTATAALTEVGVTTRVELYSDDQGDLEGFFIVPNNNELKFDAGSRKVVLTDSATNALANTTTSASVIYTARGLLQTKQQQVVSTRELSIESTGERITELVPGITTKTSTAYYDPLAQSFIIGKIPTGLYTTQIDLYFKAKSENVPLSVHLVTVENGVPTQKMIPFSKVVKKAQDSLVYETAGSGTPTADTHDVATSGVAISDKALLATRFKFESPVYLAPGVEYAIVVMSNSPDYRLWMAETGGDDTITGSRISKNTYAGVSFKSQNASTWTPDQNRDFKMKVWRAEFTNTTGFKYRLDPIGIGGSNPNFVFNNLRFLSQHLDFDTTNIKYTLSIGSTDKVIEANGRCYFDSLQTVTGAGHTSGKLHIDAELTSESNYVSPAIDLDRISIVGEDNVIGTFASLTSASLNSPQTDTELLPEHGSALARYITREVELNNASDQVNVFINANKPATASQIKVYIRTKTGDEPIRDQAFTILDPLTPIPISSDGSFGEVEFKFGGDGTIEPFTSFQIKIVFCAGNTALAPMVKDLRAIATI